MKKINQPQIFIFVFDFFSSSFQLFCVKQLDLLFFYSVAEMLMFNWVWDVIFLPS